MDPKARRRGGCRLRSGADRLNLVGGQCLESRTRKENTVPLGSEQASTV